MQGFTVVLKSSVKLFLYNTLQIFNKNSILSVYYSSFDLNENDVENTLKFAEAEDAKKIESM